MGKVGPTRPKMWGEKGGWDPLSTVDSNAFKTVLDRGFSRYWFIMIWVSISRSIDRCGLALVGADRASPEGERGGLPGFAWMKAAPGVRTPGSTCKSTARCLQDRFSKKPVGSLL